MTRQELIGNTKGFVAMTVGERLRNIPGAKFEKPQAIEERILQEYIIANMSDNNYVSVGNYVTYSKFIKQSTYTFETSSLTKMSKKYPNELFSAITWLHSAIHCFGFESSGLYRSINWTIENGVISIGNLLRNFRLYKQEKDKNSLTNFRKSGMYIHMKVNGNHVVTITPKFLEYRGTQVKLKDITVGTLQALCDTDREFDHLFTLYSLWNNGPPPVSKRPTNMPKGSNALLS